MTYNFDPERWYENELAYLNEKRASGKMSSADFESARADLELKYEKMIARLDGSYQIPDGGGS